MKLLLTIAMTCAVANAQWPDTPEMNLGICTASGEQAITKLAATADGGCYVSWFDNRGGGYDVYLQRLDALGNAKWETNGIMIADRNYSSTMDFDLAIDASGNAVVVYRQSFLSGDGIVVSRVDPSGTILWNTTVQGAGSFVASPVITAINDDVVVGWTSDNVSNFQRLNSEGTMLWSEPPSVDDPAGGTISVADIQTSTNGSVIASFVQYTSFWGNKQLKAERITSDGILVWEQQVAVMLDNSLQIGAYPDFISDGNGGGFFTWYGVNPLQCFATRISSDGIMWLAGQVQVASSFGSTERVDPVGVRDGDEFVVFFRPQDNSQNEDGIAAQRFSSDGARLWGNAGVSLKPTSSSPQYGSFAAATTDQGVVLFFDESSSWGNDVINGIHVDASGNTVWLVSVSSTPSSKSRTVAAGVDGGALLAWQDDRSGSNDIYGQRMNSDGSCGNSASCDADLNGDGIVNVSDLLQVIGSWGPCGISCPEDIDGDGTVGVSDVLSIIADWGVCN